MTIEARADRIVIGKPVKSPGFRALWIGLPTQGDGAGLIGLWRSSLCDPNFLHLRHCTKLPVLRLNEGQGRQARVKSLRFRGPKFATRLAEDHENTGGDGALLARQFGS